MGSERPLLDRDMAVAWYDRWLEAWSSQDPDMVRSLVTDDFVLESPTTRHTGWRVVGPDRARDYLAYVFRAYPDIAWERTLPPMFADDEPRAAFWWRGWGTFTGVLDPPGIAGTGSGTGTGMAYARWTPWQSPADTAPPDRSQHV